jgi:hypothetical protein
MVGPFKKVDHEDKYSDIEREILAGGLTGDYVFFRLYKLS